MEIKVGKAGLVGLMLLLGTPLASAACEESGGAVVPGASENGASSPTATPAPLPTPTATPAPAPKPAPTATPTPLPTPTLTPTPTPSGIGYGEPFVARGFELTIGAPVPYNPGNSYSNITHRVEVRLRNIANHSGEFFGDYVGAVVRGHVLNPEFCIACPSNLVLSTKYISGAEVTGYFYYVDEPEAILVKIGFFDEDEIVVGSPNTGSSGAVPPASTAPEAPATIGYGEPFVANGFELTIGTPEAYNPPNSFSEVTHRIEIRLRNTANQTNEFSVYNVWAVVGGQALGPDFCIDCPSDLTMSITRYVSGAEAIGYLYYAGEPEEIRVKIDLAGGKEAVVR